MLRFSHIKPEKRPQSLAAAELLCNQGSARVVIRRSKCQAGKGSLMDEPGADSECSLITLFPLEIGKNGREEDGGGKKTAARLLHVFAQSPKLAACSGGIVIRGGQRPPSLLPPCCCSAGVIKS